MSRDYSEVPGNLLSEAQPCSDIGNGIYAARPSLGRAGPFFQRSGLSSRIYGLRAQTCWPDPAIARVDLTFSPYYGFTSAFLPGR